jgi:Leucine-rich repeat (LRR) protein
MSLSTRKRRLEDSDDDLDGVELEYATDDVVVSLSSEGMRDLQRWKVMPSLEAYSQLTHLDLHKNRYMTKLDASVTNLPALKVLRLTQCAQLCQLPDAIGKLTNLEVVSCPVNSLLLCARTQEADPRRIS